MTAPRFAVLALLGAAFLAAPLGAFCSACCVPPAGDALSEPMPCCGDTCGPSLTAARPEDPAVASAKTKLDPPLWNVLLVPQVIGLSSNPEPLPATFTPAPTESPPASISVLRL